MKLLEGIRKVHFIGICGSGMSAVAKLLKDLGYEVTGSDSGSYEPTNTFLLKNGIDFAKQYKSENVSNDTDLIVVGTYVRLNENINEEIAKAKESSIPIVNFPDILNALTEKTHNIVCVGSSGKSTCSAIVAHCLEVSNKSPSFFIGAVLENMKENVKMGSGKFFVIEGDEYPISASKPEPKFMQYNATDVLITTIVHDHLNVYKTEEDFKRCFSLLINSLKDKSLLVINKNTESIVIGSNKPYITYSAEDSTANWYAENIKYGDTTTFTLKKGNEIVAEIKTKLFGKHNIENIIGAGAILLERSYITTEEFKNAIEKFEGLKRRLEKLTKNSKIDLFEGFGSSFEKVRSAIDAMLLRKKGRLIIFFEPHAISWRLKSYLDKYASVFDGADKVYFYTQPLKNVGAEVDVSEVISKIPLETVIMNDKNLEPLKNELIEKDTVLALTSGHFDGMLEELVTWLESNDVKVKQKT